MLSVTIKKYYNIAKIKLFPLTRSLTGKGVRKTLNIIQSEFPKFKVKKIFHGFNVLVKQKSFTNSYVNHHNREDFLFACTYI